MTTHHSTSSRWPGAEENSICDVALAPSSPNRVRTIGWTAAVLLAVTVYLAAGNTAFRGSADFHAVMEIVGALFACMTGLAMITWFCSLGTRFHLLVGLAFLVSGVEDFACGLIAFRTLLRAGSTSVISQLPVTHVFGQMLLAGLLIYAAYGYRRLGVSPNPRPEAGWLSLLGMTLLMCMTALNLATPLPNCVWPAAVIPRPLDLASALLLAVGLAGLLRKGRSDGDLLTHWLALAVAVSVIGQTIVGFSRALDDPCFELAHVFRVLGYALPLLGFSLYQTVLIRQRLTAERLLSDNETRLKALLQLNQMSEAPMQDIADFALDQAVALTGSAMGFLSFVSEDETTLTVHAWSERRQCNCGSEHHPPVFRVADGGPWTEAVRQRRPIIVNRCELFQPHASHCPAEQISDGRYLTLPVFDGQRIVAVVGVANKPTEYNQSDVHQLTLLLDGMWRLLDRKRAANDIREREGLLRATLESTADGILVTDNRGRVTHSNAHFAAMWRIPPSQLWSHEEDKLLDYVRDQLQEPEHFLAQAKALRNSEQDSFDTLHFQDGRAFERASCPLVHNGKITGRVWSYRDITQRKQSEEALRRKDEELRQSQKLEAVGQLAGGIAHEFNNLLQAISGYTDCALDGLPEEDLRRQDLGQVRAAAGRATELTRRLLGFSRRKTLERRNVQCNQLIGELIKMLQPLIGAHIELEVALDPQVQPVFVDANEVQQALLNLCLNARDAMPGGGKITIRSEDVTLDAPRHENGATLNPGPYAVITVADTGEGMSPEVQQRMFEPFFTTKEIGKGTGLGLPQVYGVVQQHEGAIQVHSRSGEGTTVKIWFPTTVAVADSAFTRHAAPVVGGTETILVAEDEPIVRELTVRLLSNAGYTVLSACDGEQALRVFRKNRRRIALVLLDAVMPKLSGPEAYRRILDLSPDTRAIFCTGYAPDTLNLDSFLADVPLVRKPFEPATLLHTVRETLDTAVPCLTTT